MSRFTLDLDVPGDLEEIWNRIGIENNSPAAALRQIEMLYDKFTLLATHPLLGESREDFGTGVRMFVVRRYLILYRPTDYGVEIIQVIHSARDIEVVVRRKPQNP